MDSKKKLELDLFANQIRMETIKEIAALGVGHVGGSMSVTETLAVLYSGVIRCDPNNPQWPERDHFVLSKGHAGPALYATLALRGFFPMEWLQTLNKPSTRLPSHCDRKRTPGIDATTGSLGQGLAVAAGIAIGKQMQKNDSWVFCILGDGECNEGEVWEAALLASHRKLDHLIAFVDYNHQMVDGFSEDICKMGDIRAKFEQFGWYAQEVDGSSVEAIWDAIEKAKQHEGSPSMIVLQTVKGQGLSMYEAKVSNHNCNVTTEEMEQALEELSAVRDRLLSQSEGGVQDGTV